jgi:hypothetical protein
MVELALLYSGVVKMVSLHVILVTIILVVYDISFRFRSVREMKE